jgi:tetratricopeptide (TPR) repeat protein
MEAAGQNGIPTAFLVNKQSVVTWIGHPMELDGVLPKVLAGKFDPKAAVREREQRQAAQGELMKLGMLMRTNEKAMYAQARKLADTTFKDDANTLNQLAWTMIEDNSPLKTKDYDTALHIAQRAATVSRFKDPMILDTLALAYFRKGDARKAVEYQQKAVKLLPTVTMPMPPGTTKEMEDRLSQFKAAAK